MKFNPDVLDAGLVAGVLLILAAGIAGLMFLPIPQANLAILASLLSGLAGTVIGGYAGYRWGASVSDRHPPATGKPGDPS